MYIRLRKIKKDDCDDLFLWRNDPATRQVCFNPELVPYKRHLDWFKKSLNNSPRQFYIGENQKKEKIGVIRFNSLSLRIAEININLAPAMRQKGYGTSLIRMACKRFAKENKKTLFIARVKKINAASLKVFKKSGFREIFTYNDGILKSDIVVLGSF